MSQSTQAKRGHAPQQSVADAAMLFGSASDDPFASIGGADVEPIAEEGAILEEEAADLPAADTPNTPRAPGLALPESTHEEPAANTTSGTVLAASPSTLFAGSSDLFPASASADWLNQAAGTQESDQVFDGYEAHEGAHLEDDVTPSQDYPQSHFTDDNREGHDYSGGEYTHQPSDQYGEQYDYGTLGEDTYVQEGQGQSAADFGYEHQEQRQYEAYDTQQGQYYDQQQPMNSALFDPNQHVYDPNAYTQQAHDPSMSYGQGGAEYVSTYDQQPQQYYGTSNGPTQHAEYEYEQYGAEATHDPSAYGQQATFDEPAQPYGEAYNYEESASWDQQQGSMYDASTFDGPAYSSNPYMNSTGPAAVNGTNVSAFRDDAGIEGTPRLAEESLPALQSMEDHVAGIEEKAAGSSAPTQQGNSFDEHSDAKADDFTSSTSDTNATQANLFDLDSGEDIDPYKENGMYDATVRHDDSLLYAGEEDGHYGMKGSAAANHGSREAPPVIAPYAPPAADVYAGSSYGEYAPEQYSAYSGDTTFQAPYEQADAALGGEDTQWQPSEAPAGDAYSTFNPYQSYPNEQHQQGVDATAGYFDNVSVPSVPPYGSTDATARSVDVNSPYTPNAGENGATPIGNAGYVAEERAVDAAEERHRAKIPLACFTIDGKLLTFFPTWSQDASTDAYAGGAGSYGLGRSAAPTRVMLRDLRSVVPPTSYSSTRSPLDFPGPALEVIPSQGSALSRATGSATASSKAKKASLIKYLNDAATEMTSGIGYLTAGKHAAEARRMQDRILLLRLLIILLEQDGNMVSGATFDTAVKDLLLADEIEAPAVQTSSSVSSVDVPPAPSTEQKASMLHQIEALLTAGNRKDAVSLAVEKKLWTHAVIIASGMDRSTWREVVGQFVEEEFSGGDTSSGLHGVKVAYNLFSGQEPKATYDLFRPKASFTVGDAGQNSEASALASHSYWRKSMATIIANRSSGDAATITAMGDGLKMSGWIEAAHICYLLSPSTSSIDGYDGASTRMTLLGAASPEASTMYIRDLDHIILTEVLEYAQSLQPVAKGQEPYHGLAYLQPYRLLHAYLLAEMGEVKKALRYCEAITTLLKHGKMNRHYHSVLLQQLQELSHRLQGDSKGSNWTKKKPTMDGVWGALEGRFTKFIAGEDEGGKDVAAASKGQGTSAVGPFTHYSAITPDARSGGVSRVQSHADFSAGQGLSVTSVSQPHSRPGSALNYTYHRAASASEYEHGDWGTPTASAHAKDTSNRSSPKLSVGQQSSSDAESYAGPYTTHASKGSPWYRQDGSVGRAEEDEYGVAAAPADSTYYGYQPHGATHSQFASNVDTDLSDAMYNATLDDSLNVIGNAPTPGSAVNSYAPTNNHKYNDAAGADEEEEEDLGFGNKSSRPAPMGDDKGKVREQSKEPSASPEKKVEPENRELKPAASWFGRLWKRDASGDTGESTKGKKAHLGEEVSFYYDKDLKRWVNKKAGDSGQAAAPPPPPPRAQTASPSAMGNGVVNGRPPEGGSRRVFSEARPPPAAPSSGSSASSMDRISATPPIQETGERSENDGPPSRPSTTGRSRSNLADLSQPPAMQPGPSATPPIRPGTTDGGPPRTVSGSGIKKKPISKRYVRVD